MHYSVQESLDSLFTSLRKILLTNQIRFVGVLSVFSSFFAPKPNYADINSFETINSDDLDFLDTPTESAAGPTAADRRSPEFDSSDTTESDFLRENSSVANNGDLSKIIRDPKTGTTYYLDEKAMKYYYVDPETKLTVYYSS